MKNSKKEVSHIVFGQLMQMNDENFLRHIYHEILMRAPDQEGLLFYKNKLRNGMKRLEVIAQLRKSSEAKNINNEPTQFDELLRDYKYSKLPVIGSFFSYRAKKHSENLKIIERQLNSDFKSVDSEHVDLTLSNEDKYKKEQKSQDEYISRYLAHGISAKELDVLADELLQKISGKTKVVIYPLSYPRDLKQRPDHVLRFFAEKNCICIFLEINAKEPYVIKDSENIYVTNIFAGVIDVCAQKNVIFYLTYPFYAYLVKYFKNKLVIYDVLDELSVFSLCCKAMTDDHLSLLANSDIVTYSSDLLIDVNSKNTRSNYNFLVSNAVWASDFDIKESDLENVKSFKHFKNEYVIGYHGAISELLDWELLSRIIEISGVRLVFIGPLTNFSNDVDDDSIRFRSKVLSSNRVTHVGSVSYNDLKYYMRAFDAAIIPFCINEKTDPVSPLKLFEYFAMGLKVFATPTKTLKEFSNLIEVFDPDTLPEKIHESLLEYRTTGKQRISYREILEKYSWSNQLEPIYYSIQRLLGQKIDGDVKSVDIVNINFYDWDGEVLYKGGAERYIYDLACLLKVHGYKVRIIQNANSAFEKDFNGIPVVGVVTGNGYDMRAVSRKYRSICADSDLVITSPLDLSCELWGSKVIGINHGIHWDHKFKKIENYDLDQYANVFDSLKVLSKGVCVDTNFINWVRTYDYDLGRKLHFIPNYYDANQFTSFDKNFYGKLRIVYPRRLYEARGIFITLEAFDEIFDKYPDVELYLVGQANADDEKIVSKFINKHCDRVVWEEFDMEDMHKAYASSHVALIPTLFAEGTSLSCIEAMATNNAIVATNVGGLPNLVIDGFNGMLIEPTAKSLFQALEKLILDRQMIQGMAANGLKMASCFEKEKWKSRWIDVVNEVLTK